MASRWPIVDTNKEFRYTVRFKVSSVNDWDERANCQKDTTTMSGAIFLEDMHGIQEEKSHC